MNTVDVNVPRFNQACVAILTALAFVTQVWVLVPIVAAILAITRFLGPRYGLFTRIYVGLIRPRLEGPVVTEPAAPPRFAQLLGAVFLTVATVLFLAGWMTAGWAVTLMVTALAALASTTRICVGCIIYERVVA